MKIIITPDELVKLCLWDDYVYYIVGSDKEAEKTLRENKEFEISDKDALVIGLIRCLESENLIHKFNLYITDFITSKSVKSTDSNGSQLNIVRKISLENAIVKFMSKFPSYWEPSIKWKESIKDLNEYVHRFMNSINKMEIIIHYIYDSPGEYINVNAIKKELKFNYI